MPTIQPNLFWKKVNIKSPEECWLWLGCKYERYGKYSHQTAHRVAYYLYTGHKPTSEEYICHTCDNPMCVNPHHLFLGTQYENMQDMVRKGRNAPTDGENNARHKLSKNDVIEIRRLKSVGVKRRNILKEFPIGTAQYSRIILNKSWKGIN
jgi:hypothetical protein